VTAMADAPDPARARVRALAQEALAAGNATGWFERLYAEAGGDATAVPWADLTPNPAFAQWALRPASLVGVKTAAVVGCGLGHDAELLAARGVRVTAFDVSESAIAWARRLHPASPVKYHVADLFVLPPAWRGTFDLVVEVYTLQALPRSVRPAATSAILSLLAPGGRLFVFTRVRDDAPGGPPFDERDGGPPWPLGRTELAGFLAGLAPVERLVEAVDPADPAVVRAHGVWRRAK
jgi:SAM-dependent methyltransferase